MEPAALETPATSGRRCDFSFPPASQGHNRRDDVPRLDQARLRPVVARTKALVVAAVVCRFQRRASSDFSCVSVSERPMDKVLDLLIVGFHWLISVVSGRYRERAVVLWSRQVIQQHPRDNRMAQTRLIPN